MLRGWLRKMWGGSSNDPAKESETQAVRESDVDHQNVSEWENVELPSPIATDVAQKNLNRSAATDSGIESVACPDEQQDQSLWETISLPNESQSQSPSANVNNSACTGPVVEDINDGGAGDGLILESHAAQVTSSLQSIPEQPIFLESQSKEISKAMHAMGNDEATEKVVLKDPVEKSMGVDVTQVLQAAPEKSPIDGSFEVIQKKMEEVSLEGSVDDSQKSVQNEQDLQLEVKPIEEPGSKEGCMLHDVGEKQSVTDQTKSDGVQESGKDCKKPVCGEEDLQLKEVEKAECVDTANIEGVKQEPIPGEPVVDQCATSDGTKDAGDEEAENLQEQKYVVPHKRKRQYAETMVTKDEAGASDKPGSTAEGGRTEENPSNFLEFVDEQTKAEKLVRAKKLIYQLGFLKELDPQEIQSIVMKQYEVAVKKKSYGWIRDARYFAEIIFSPMWIDENLQPLDRKQKRNKNWNKKKQQKDRWQRGSEYGEYGLDDGMKYKDVRLLTNPNLPVVRYNCGKKAPAETVEPEMPQKVHKPMPKSPKKHTSPAHESKSRSSKTVQVSTPTKGEYPTFVCVTPAEGEDALSENIESVPEEKVNLTEQSKAEVEVCGTEKVIENGEAGDEDVLDNDGVDEEGEKFPSFMLIPEGEAPEEEETGDGKYPSFVLMPGAPAGDNEMAEALAALSLCKDKSEVEKNECDEYPSEDQSNDLYPPEVQSNEEKPLFPSFMMVPATETSNNLDEDACDEILAALGENDDLNTSYPSFMLLDPEAETTDT